MISVTPVKQKSPEKLYIHLILKWSFFLIYYSWFIYYQSRLEWKDDELTEMI